MGSRKLEKLLGAEYASKVAADHKPWYLRPNYSPEDILIEADNTVKGGTLPSLVERLTAHDQVGMLLPFHFVDLMLMLVFAVQILLSTRLS